MAAGGALPLAVTASASAAQVPAFLTAGVSGFFNAGAQGLQRSGFPIGVEVPGAVERILLISGCGWGVIR